VCTKAALSTFELIKNKLYLAPILALLNFEIMFKAKCDTSGLSFNVVFTQAKHSLAYSSEKLNASRLNSPSYEKE